MDNYNFNPNSYEDFFSNAENLVKKYFKFDGIEEYHLIKNNIAVYHALQIDMAGCKTIDDVKKYMDAKPRIENKNIAEWLKKKQEIKT